VSVWCERATAFRRSTIKGRNAMFRGFNAASMAFLTRVVLLAAALDARWPCGTAHQP
jgi:hypothetical protein